MRKHKRTKITVFIWIICYSYSALRSALKEQRISAIPESTRFRDVARSKRFFTCSRENLTLVMGILLCLSCSLELLRPYNPVYP